MAAVAIEVSGVLYDKLARTSRPVLLRGMASIIGLEIDGGPMPGGPGLPGGPVDPGYGYPEHPVDPGYGVPERPRGDHIWGPNDPRPQPPIANVPGVPPSIDPPPDTTPDDNGFLKPPPPQGGWAFHETYKWGYYPAPGESGPK